MRYTTDYCGLQVTTDVDTGDLAVDVLIAERRAFAAWRAHMQAEAIATRGLSLQPREHPAARITREFYLTNGRFPTMTEILRHAMTYR
jgi:hypothetical protein